MPFIVTVLFSLFFNIVFVQRMITLWCENAAFKSLRMLTIRMNCEETFILWPLPSYKAKTFLFTFLKLQKVKDEK